MEAGGVEGKVWSGILESGSQSCLFLPHSKVLDMVQSLSASLTSDISEQ